MNKVLNQNFLYIVIIAISFLLYPILNQTPHKAHILKIWLDNYIPLVPIFSIPYVLFIPYIVFTLVFLVYFSGYAISVTISFVFCFVVASLFYIFFQTTVPRPTIASIDVFSSLVKFIYTIDEPYNCFPSLHVTLSTLAYLYWRKITKKLWIYLETFTVLIVLSTLFIKQHFIPDVISGIFLAVLSYYIGAYNVTSTRKG